MPHRCVCATGRARASTPIGCGPSPQRRSTPRAELSNVHKAMAGAGGGIRTMQRMGGTSCDPRTCDVCGIALRKGILSWRVRTVPPPPWGAGWETGCPAVPRCSHTPGGDAAAEGTGRWRHQPGLLSGAALSAHPGTPWALWTPTRKGVRDLGPRRGGVRGMPRRSSSFSELQYFSL